MSTEQHIFEGNGPPNQPPLFVGAHWIDKTNGHVYISSGIMTASDWGEPINRRHLNKCVVRTIPAPAIGYEGVVIDKIKKDDEYVRVNALNYDHILNIPNAVTEGTGVGRITVVKHVVGSAESCKIQVTPGLEEDIKLNIYLPEDMSVSIGSKSAIYVRPFGAVSLIYAGLDGAGKQIWDIEGDYTVEGVDP